MVGMQVVYLGGVIHLLRGEVYNIDNKRIGVMGGANSIDKYSRWEGIDWWPQEVITENDIGKLLTKTVANSHLDIMLTHDCPSKKVNEIGAFSGVNKIKYFTKSQQMLEVLDNSLDIDKWYFGHWHTNIRLDNKFECLYTNIKQI
jgi:hypothetical protein